MATYTASGDGCIDAAVSAAKVMLSRCAAVQTFLGAGSEAAALAAIDINADAQPADGEERTFAEMESIRPRVLVFGEPEEGIVLTRDAVGSYMGSGVVSVVLERELTTNEEANDALWIDAMQTTLGRVADELWQQEAKDAALAMSEMVLIGPFRGNENTVGDLDSYCKAMINIAFGVSQR